MVKGGYTLHYIRNASLTFPNSQVGFWDMRFFLRNVTQFRRTTIISHHRPRPRYTTRTPIHARQTRSSTPLVVICAYLPSPSPSSSSARTSSAVTHNPYISEEGRFRMVLRGGKKEGCGRGLMPPPSGMRYGSPYSSTRHGLAHGLPSFFLRLPHLRHLMNILPPPRSRSSSLRAHTRDIECSGSVRVCVLSARVYVC